jgi:hypothetical protein
MLFSDRDRAIREMLRVLAPRGRCAVAVWDAVENVPAFAALVDLLDRVAGKAAGDALRAPFALGDRQALAASFQRAGAASVDLTTRPGTACFPSMREFVEAELRGWLPVMGVVLPEPAIERILAEAASLLSSYVASDGRLAFGISAHVAAFSKP